MDINELDRPVSWGEILLALGPFLLFAAFFAFVFILPFFLSDMSNPTYGLVAQLIVVGLVLIVLFAGWVKDFPRWVFPYWGFALVITLYMYGFTGTISGHPFRGDWRVWIPIGGVALLGTLWTRSLRPIHMLFKSVWKDWTLLSFIFYGALPVLFVFAYDEVQNEGLMRTLVILVPGIGTVFYMRAENAWHRFASLVGGFTIGWLVVMIHLGIYWNGRQLFWMTKPGSWIETLNWTSQMGAALMLILVAPVLVAFIHWVTKSRRPPESA